MTEIKYIHGDATRPIGTGPKIIAHCCNNIGAWGSGFVIALSRRWPAPEIDYRSSSPWPLGSVSLVEVEPDTEVANIIGQVMGWRGNNPPIRYDAIREGFEWLAERRPAASFHMPRIGCGLAGGDWTTMEGVIKETLCEKSIQVTVYDLWPPTSHERKPKNNAPKSCANTIRKRRFFNFPPLAGG